MSKRVIHGTYDDVKVLLQSQLGSSCLLEHFSCQLRNASTTMINTSGIGPAILVLEVSMDDINFAIPVWIGAKSLGLLVDKSAQKKLNDQLSTGSCLP